MKVEVLVRHIEFNGIIRFISLILYQLSELVEFGGELFLGLSFSLLLLELIKVVSSSASSHVNIVSHDTRLLEELNVIHLLVGDRKRLVQGEMEDCH